MSNGPSNDPAFVQPILADVDWLRAECVLWLCTGDITPERMGTLLARLQQEVDYWTERAGAL